MTLIPPMPVADVEREIWKHVEPQLPEAVGRAAIESAYRGG